MSFQQIDDIKEAFLNSDCKARTEAFLCERLQLFWDYANFENSITKLIKMDSNIGKAGLILSAKCINHSIAAYQMLLDTMQDEFWILYRQSVEVSWLIQYFYDNPGKEDEWLGTGSEYFPPRLLRKSIDENTVTKELYDRLSGFSHPKRQSIRGVVQNDGENGVIITLGNYDEQFLKGAYACLILNLDSLVKTIFNLLQRQYGFEIEKLIVDTNLINDEDIKQIIVLFKKYLELKGRMEQDDFIKLVLENINN